MRRTLFGIIPLVCALSLTPPAHAQKEEGPSLGSLLDGLKDLKVPESVSDLPKQLTELKQSYVDTAATVDQLRIEVAALREELAALRSDNEELRAAVGGKVKVDQLEALQKPISISADELAAAYNTDRIAASEKYGNRYLKVIGMIERFESGTNDIVIALSSKEGPGIKCHVAQDASFWVEAVPNQGRLVNKEDRSIVLAEGQPVAILGTVTGLSLDLHLQNCRVDGLTVKKPADEPEKKK